MTKRDWIRSQRVSPMGEEGVAAFRSIVENGVAKVNEVLVDVYSASAFVQVYDAINERNQEKLRGMGVGQAMDTVWAVIKKQQQRNAS